MAYYKNGEYWNMGEHIYPAQLPYEGNYAYAFFKIYCRLKEKYQNCYDYHKILIEESMKTSNADVLYMSEGGTYWRVPKKICLDGMHTFYQWDERINNEPFTDYRNNVPQTIKRIWMCPIGTDNMKEPSDSYSVLHYLIEHPDGSLKEASEELNLSYKKVIKWASQYHYRARLTSYSEWTDVRPPIDMIKTEIENAYDNTSWTNNEDNDIHTNNLSIDKTRNLSEYVYVVINPVFKNKEGTVKCKIGKTTDWEKRLRGLNNTSIPYDFKLVMLFGRMYGSYDLEHKLHSIFSKYHDAKEFYDLPLKALLSLRYDTLLDLNLNEKGYEIIACSPEWEQRFEEYLNNQREVQV